MRAIMCALEKKSCAHWGKKQRGARTERRTPRPHRKKHNARRERRAPCLVLCS
ncbi:hypothetical protein C8R44DRAFT_821638, partial [Mycena epipterygia]